MKAKSPVARTEVPAEALRIFRRRLFKRRLWWYPAALLWAWEVLSIPLTLANDIDFSRYGALAPGELQADHLGMLVRVFIATALGCLLFIWKRPTVRSLIEDGKESERWHALARVAEMYLAQRGEDHS
jgi:hypothetical protein